MHLQSLLFSALSVSAVSLGWSALDKPSASNLIWDDKPAVVVYPQADKNPDGSFATNGHSDDAAYTNDMIVVIGCENGSPINTAANTSAIRRPY